MPFFSFNSFKNNKGDFYELRSKIAAQDTDKQNKQQIQSLQRKIANSQQEENEINIKPREDYTNLKRVYSIKAVVQIVFGAGVLYNAYSDYNLLPSSALIYFHYINE